MTLHWHDPRIYPNGGTSLCLFDNYGKIEINLFSRDIALSSFTKRPFSVISHKKMGHSVCVCLASLAVPPPTRIVPGPRFVLRNPSKIYLTNMAQLTAVNSKNL